MSKASRFDRGQRGLGVNEFVIVVAVPDHIDLVALTENVEVTVGQEVVGWSIPAEVISVEYA